MILIKALTIVRPKTIHGKLFSKEIIYASMHVIYQK